MGTGDPRVGFSAHDCLIVAEIGQAHDGSLGTAHAYIDAVADAGAGAVKFQTHIADAESTLDEPWRVRFSPQDETRYKYWKRMEFTCEQWKGLKHHASERGLLFLSSPFSLEAVDLLENTEVDMYKVASGEITNTPLLREISKTGRPTILSSGMSPYEEIDHAVDVLASEGAPLAVLQCSSEYPCPPEQVGLNVINELKARYDLPVGLSDHSGTIFAGLAAATLGISVIEIHVTISRKLYGPDIPASITVEELSTLVKGIDFIIRASNNPVNKGESLNRYERVRLTFMKSIVAARDLRKGHVLELRDLGLKKPGTGLPANRIDSLIGTRLLRSIDTNEQLSEDDLDTSEVT